MSSPPKTPRRREPERRRAPEPGKRQMVLMAFGLALAVAFYWLMSNVEEGPFELAFPGMAAPGMQLEDDSFIAQRTRVMPLDGVELRRMREQRQLVDELARRHVGTPLTAGQSFDDLRVLQELLDKKVLGKDETYELQALGVALGDLMAEQLDLRWVAVEDDRGRSRALQYGEQEDLIFPVTMISKRVEADVRFSIQELWDKTRKTVQEIRVRVGDARELSL